MSLTILRHRIARHYSWAIVCVLVAGSIVGCGGGDACSLSGQVTFEGQPIGDGNIRLNPIEGTPGKGGAAKIVNGAYEIAEGDGMLAGKHQVLISATRGTGRMMRAENLDGGPSQTEYIEQYIPARYNRATELVLDLEPGENEKNFPLEP
jgi:hypothetical protein